MDVRGKMDSRVGDEWTMGGPEIGDGGDGDARAPTMPAGRERIRKSKRQVHTTPRYYTRTLSYYNTRRRRRRPSRTAVTADRTEPRSPPTDRPVPRSPPTVMYHGRRRRPVFHAQARDRARTNPTDRLRAHEYHHNDIRASYNESNLLSSYATVRVYNIYIYIRVRLHTIRVYVYTHTCVFTRRNKQTRVCDGVFFAPLIRAPRRGCGCRSGSV